VSPIRFILCSLQFGVLLTFEKLDAIPPSLLRLLRTILDELTRIEPATALRRAPTSLQLPADLPSALSIPLAAILLDYPVAYVPGGDQVSFLSGVPLVLYRCWVHGYPPSNRERNHLLLQFSCPLSLADVSSAPTSIEWIVSHLKVMFEPRLLQSLPESTFQVGYEYVTLDRVAL
jgi:hypothetical protein